MTASSALRVTFFMIRSPFADNTKVVYTTLVCSS
jgi:hypothetical protein